MVALPRAEGFLYCITLRFGVYLIALFDFVSGIMTLGRSRPAHFALTGRTCAEVISG